MPARRGAFFWLKVLAPMLASIAGLACLRLLAGGVVNQHQLSSWLRPLGDYAPIGFIVFLSIRPLTLLPGQIFTAVGGLLFGTLAGSLYALLGSFLGGCLLFALCRAFGSRLMKRLAGDRYEALEQAVSHYDFKASLLLTLNPLFPTDVMIALSAASGGRWGPTLAGVMLGILPGTFLTAQFGSALGQGKTLLSLLSAALMVVTSVFGVVLGRKIASEVERSATSSRWPHRRATSSA